MKKQVQTSAIVPVMPVSIIGTQRGGKMNFAPHGQIGTVAAQPPTVYTSVVREHQTARNIRETGRFSVNIPSADLLEQVRICGSLSGARVDKSALFETFEAEGVPMIQNCPVCFACEVIQHTELSGFDVFLARVTVTYAEEDCMRDGWPVPRLVNPLLCGIDGKLWTAGEEQILSPRCQSCGLPFDADHRAFVAKESDGNDSAYCTFCYGDGAFRDPDATVEDMIHTGVPHLAQKIGEDAARRQLGVLVPSLARWLKE